MSLVPPSRSGIAGLPKQSLLTDGSWPGATAQATRPNSRSLRHSRLASPNALGSGERVLDIIGTAGGRHLLKLGQGSQVPAIAALDWNRVRI
jgi:hypothetical protein